MRNVGKAHFLRFQNPKSGSNKRDDFLCGVRNRKVLPIYRVLLQLQVRHFCRQVFRLECEVRTTVTEKCCRLECHAVQSARKVPPSGGTCCLIFMATAMRTWCLACGKSIRADLLCFALLRRRWGAPRFFEPPVNFCHSTRRLVSEDLFFVSGQYFLKQH